MHNNVNFLVMKTGVLLRVWRIASNEIGRICLRLIDLIKVIWYEIVMSSLFFFMPKSWYILSLSIL